MAGTEVEVRAKARPQHLIDAAQTGAPVSDHINTPQKMRGTEGGEDNYTEHTSHP